VGVPGSNFLKLKKKNFTIRPQHYLKIKITTNANFLVPLAIVFILIYKNFDPCSLLFLLLIFRLLSFTLTQTKKGSDIRIQTFSAP